MQVIFNFGAGLALLILVIWLRGLLTNPVHQHEMRVAWYLGWRVLLRNLWVTDLGVTITYTSQFAGYGTNTAPTAVQASQLQEQTAQVFFADADTQAVPIHNWGSLPGASSWASFLHPQIIFYAAQNTSSTSFETGFTFGLSNTNSITINKLSVIAGSGGTYNLIMRRPHSIGG